MTPQSSSLPFDGDDDDGGDDDAVELADVVVVAEETMVDKVVGAGGGGGGGGGATAAAFTFVTLLTMSTSLLPELVEPEPVLGGVDGIDVGGADEEAAGAGAGLLPEEPPPHMSASSVE